MKIVLFLVEIALVLFLVQMKNIRNNCKKESGICYDLIIIIFRLLINKLIYKLYLYKYLYKKCQSLK